MRPFLWVVCGALALALLVPGGQVFAGRAGVGRLGETGGAGAAASGPGGPAPPAPPGAAAPGALGAASAPGAPAAPAAPGAAPPASLPVVNPDQVYTYELLTRDLQELAARHSGLVHLRSIGRSHFGRELWALGVGTGPAAVLINGAHHGSEWLTVNLVAAMADHYALAAAAGEPPAGAAVWFVPMSNPDGVALAQLGLSAFPPEAHAQLRQLNGGSDDFRAWKANARGVDLNRQYPADWENIKASPAAPAFSHFKGTQPLTEPESKALYDFTLEIGPEIVAAYHSAGRVIFWHFRTAPENLERDLRIAQRLAGLTGYDLVPGQEDPSGGGYKDWFVQALGRPGYTLEIGAYGNGDPLPLSAFAAEWERNRLVVLALAEEAILLYGQRTAGRRPQN